MRVAIVIIFFTSFSAAAQLKIGVTGGVEFTDVYTDKFIPEPHDLNATKHAESLRIESEYEFIQNFSGLFSVGYLKRLPVDYYVFQFKEESGSYSSSLEFYGQPRHEQSEHPYDPEFDGGPYPDAHWVFVGTGIQYSQPLVLGFAIDGSVKFRLGRLFNQEETTVEADEVGSRILPSVLWFSDGDPSRVKPIVLKNQSQEFVGSLGLKYSISERLSFRLSGEIFRSRTQVHKDKQYGGSFEDKWQGFGFFGTLLYTLKK